MVVKVETFDDAGVRKAEVKPARGIVHFLECRCKRVVIEDVCVVERCFVAECLCGFMTSHGVHVEEMYVPLSLVRKGLCNFEAHATGSGGVSQRTVQKAANRDVMLTTASDQGTF